MKRTITTFALVSILALSASNGVRVVKPADPAGLNESMRELEQAVDSLGRYYEKMDAGRHGRGPDAKR